MQRRSIGRRRDVNKVVGELKTFTLPEGRGVDTRGHRRRESHEEEFNTRVVNRA